MEHACPRVVAIVQARMGSTRLPGKVLRPIAGKPLLWHIVQRLRQARTIDEIAIATTSHPRDEAIVAFGCKHEVRVVRGPEQNVLARFAVAAEELRADVIVRVSSDAPFIDAGFVDHLVSALIAQDGDYVLLEDGAITAHEGVDPFSRRALRKLTAEASEDPAALEHVTGYFKLHPEFVKIVRAAPYPALARRGARLTIDTPDDLAFVEAIHERLNAKAGEASLADLLLLLEREPQLTSMNAHVKQKTISTAGALALIRCDGGRHLGYGHVKRMLSLARNLRDREGIGVIFAVHGTSDALQPIVSAGFEALLLEPEQEVEQLQQTVAMHQPDILICDMREGVGAQDLRSLKNDVALLAVVDDGSERRLVADVAYYPPVPQALALDWRNSGCAPRIGWEWALLGAGSSSSIPKPNLSEPTLLVTMGGSDPAGLTLRAANALVRCTTQLRARFVIGPGMKDSKPAARMIAELSSSFEPIEACENLSAEIARADLALCAFGVTAYELAAQGVPAIYLSLTEDHALSASAFEAAGIGLSLGVHTDLGDGEIAEGVDTLLADGARRRAMRAAGLMTIDGNGAARTAADLRARLETRRVQTLATA